MSTAKKYVCFNGTQFNNIINTSAFDLKYHGLHVWSTCRLKSLNSLQWILPDSSGIYILKKQSLKISNVFTDNSNSMAIIVMATGN